jgi:hypothetical protein
MHVVELSGCAVVADVVGRDRLRRGVGVLDAVDVRPTADLVRAATTVEHVRAATAVEDVVARPADQGVGAGIAEQVVAPERTVDRLDVRVNVHPLPALPSLARSSRWTTSSPLSSSTLSKPGPPLTSSAPRRPRSCRLRRPRRGRRCRRRR